jgi:hypothetical protein
MFFKFFISKNRHFSVLVKVAIFFDVLVCREAKKFGKHWFDKTRFSSEIFYQKPLPLSFEIVIKYLFVVFSFYFSRKIAKKSKFSRAQTYFSRNTKILLINFTNSSKRTKSYHFLFFSFSCLQTMTHELFILFHSMWNLPTNLTHERVEELKESQNHHHYYFMMAFKKK